MANNLNGQNKSKNILNETGQTYSIVDLLI